MRWLLPASSVILLVCSAACSDEGLPLEIARLDTPLSSTVTTYADGGGLLARAVVTPSFVAYRGDGDAWVSLGALGPVTAYQIEHPRYTLWVACPGVEGEPTQVNLLFLTSEDTLEPAVLCDPAPPIDGLRSLSLVVGETNNRMLRMAAGSINTAWYDATGSLITITSFSQGSGPYDLVTMSSDGPNDVGLWIDRDVALAGELEYTANPAQPFLPFSFGSHPSRSTETNEQTDHLYVTRNRTAIVMPSTGLQSLAIVPDEARDSGDIDLVSAWTRDGDNGLAALSYRQDPRDTNLAYPDPLIGGAIRNVGARRFSLELPTGQAGIQVMQAHLQPSESPLTIDLWISERWLAESALVDVDFPPSYDPSQVLGAPGDSVVSRAWARWSNRDSRSLAESIQHEGRVVPRSLDGLDVAAASIGLQSGTVE